MPAQTATQQPATVNDRSESDGDESEDEEEEDDDDDDGGDASDDEPVCSACHCEFIIIIIFRPTSTKPQA